MTTIFSSVLFTLPDSADAFRRDSDLREGARGRDAEIRAGPAGVAARTASRAHPASQRPAALAAGVSIPAAALPAGIAPRIPFQADRRFEVSSCPERANKMGKMRN